MEKEKGSKASFVYMVFVYLFFYLPIFAIIIGSVNQNEYNTGFGGLTFDWYSKLLQNSDLLESFQNTIVLAVISTLVSVFLGTIAAFGMFRYKFKGKNLIDTLFYIPIIVPEVVLGISLLTIFTTLNIPTGLLTLAIAHVTFCVPYVVFNVRASIAGFDPAMEEASMDLGASRLSTFLRITLPLIVPGILSGAFMSCTLSFDDVIVSYFTNGPGYVTLPIQIMGMARRMITPDVDALETIIVFAVDILAILAQLNYKKLYHRLTDKVRDRPQKQGG